MAQSIAGTSLCANAISHNRKVLCQVDVAWGQTWATLSASDWVDESAHVLAVDGNMSLAEPGVGLTRTGAADVNTARVTLRNYDNRYSPWNTNSAIYASTCGGQLFMTPISVCVGFDAAGTPEMLHQFAGVIARPTEETISKTATWECKDRSWTFRSTKYATSVCTDITPDAYLGALCTQASIAAADRTFDEGSLSFPYAWMDEENIAAEMQDVAQADGGMLYFNKSGSLIYENINHWLSDTDCIDTAGTFDFTVSDFQELQPEFTHNEVYSGVIVEQNVRERGAIHTVYSRTDPIYIEPAGTQTIKCRLNKPILSLETPEEDTDYLIMTGGGRKVSGSVSITSTSYAQQVDVTFTNSSSAYGMYITRFELRGEALWGGPVAESKEESTGGYIEEEKLLELRGNSYIQRQAQADMLAKFLRDRTERPREIYHLSGVPGIPWLELTDRISITEADSGITACAHIFGLGWRFIGGAGALYEQDITAVNAANLFPYDSASYFVIGSCEMSGSDSAILAY